MLGNNAVIEKAPAWFKEFTNIADLDDSIKQTIEHADFTISIGYEASSLGDPDPDWHGAKPRSKQNKAKERIQIANLALWLAKPSCIGFELIVDAQFAEPNWHLRQARRIDRLVPHVRYKDNYLNAEDFEKAKKLFLPLCAIRDGSIWRSTATLSWALTNDYWDHRYLLLWIALESLFGPDDPREITYRMSQRIAFFNAESRTEAKEICDIAKNGYKCRSKIIHGKSLSEPEIKNSEQILFDVEQLIRKALSLILSDSQLIDKLNSGQREQYLDSLIFSE